MEEKDLGLYYYVSRWYDPSLGRFIQADTLVPDPGNPQSYDRYAYVNNNSLKFGDPSGHFGVIPLGPDLTPGNMTSIVNKAASNYGISFVGQFFAGQKSAIVNCARLYGNAVGRVVDFGSPESNFRFLFGTSENDPLEFHFKYRKQDTPEGEMITTKKINMYNFGKPRDNTSDGMRYYLLKVRNTILHELGHVVDTMAGGTEFGNISGHYEFEKFHNKYYSAGFPSAPAEYNDKLYVVGEPDPNDFNKALTENCANSVISWVTDDYAENGSWFQIEAGKERKKVNTLFDEYIRFLLNPESK